jgi:hypothetical protein
MFVLPNQVEGRADFALRKTCELCQRDCWLEPELGLTVLALYVHMHSRFLAREEIESKTTLAKNSWTHGKDDTRNTCSRKRPQERHGHTSDTTTGLKAAEPLPSTRTATHGACRTMGT